MFPKSQNPSRFLPLWMQDVQSEAGTSNLLCFFVYAWIQCMDRCDPVANISEPNLE